MMTTIEGKRSLRTFVARAQQNVVSWTERSRRLSGESGIVQITQRAIIHNHTRRKKAFRRQPMGSTGPPLWATASRLGDYLSSPRE